MNRNFYNEGNTQSETETMNDVENDIITKQHVTPLSNDEKNSMQNDTVDNQNYINNSKMMEIEEIGQSEK